MAWEKFKFAETDTVLPAKIIVCDELAEFIEGVDRKDMRDADRLQDNFQSIARLGRSAHIHIVLATQSASGNLFPSSLKNNIATRMICGRVEANISRMAIDSEEGESLPLTPGSYLGYSKGETQQFQGYYTPTKRVLALGTVKDGFNHKTGLPESGDSFDMSPVDDNVADDDDNLVETSSDMPDTDNDESPLARHRRELDAHNDMPDIEDSEDTDNSDDSNDESDNDNALDIGNIDESNIDIYDSTLSDSGTNSDITEKMNIDISDSPKQSSSGAHHIHISNTGDKSVKPRIKINIKTGASNDKHGSIIE